MPEKKTAIKMVSKEKDPEEKDFQIDQLFGSKTRVRLLSLFLDNPERAYYVRELTRRIDAQLNSVRRELGNLIDLGIIIEVEGEIVKGESAEEEKKTKKKNEKKKFYQADKNFIFFDELRGIMKKASILMNRSFVRELTKKGKVDFMFLTGRFIDNAAVPSDLLIVGKVTTTVLQKAIGDFEKQIGREVNYTYMPREEFEYRMEVKDRFLESLLNTEKVVLINRLDESL